MEHGKWRIEDLETAEAAINILHDRSIRDKTEIDLLTAKVDLLTTPWWNQRARRRTKKWISVLAAEMEEGL